MPNGLIEQFTKQLSELLTEWLLTRSNAVGNSPMV
jgi:hypothetical protein